MKIKTCKCGQDYNQFTSLQNCCIDCLAVKVAKKRINSEKAAKKAQSRELKAAKTAIKPLKYFADKAQVVINKYVRLRDSHLGCVSCDKPASWNGQWHASHFRSRGAASSIRFNLWNIHKSCSICNNWKSGNLSEYEPRLREKIGDIKVDWLRAQNQRADYSVEYLKRLIMIFNKKNKALAKKIDMR
jgi:hypothetical protein